MVAGAPESSFSAPVRKDWIELGWYNVPGDVLAAVDVFVLPNRQTFFDLVVLEALALKTPIIASDTGGNKSVHRLTEGAIMLFDGTATALRNAVVDFFGDRELQNNLSKKFEGVYASNFTAEQFAQRYEQVIKRIWKDYSI